MNTTTSSSISSHTGELKSSTAGEHHRTMVLTLSTPTLRNALSPAMCAAGVEALNFADSSDEIRSVVITGEGVHFSAGGNVQRLHANLAQPIDVQMLGLDGLHAWIEAIRSCRKPVIAAVEGAAAGAGFSLCLACDLIVAARDAVFAMAHTNVALSPDGGASWQLARSLPHQLASELLLGGERISAERLHALGIVNRLAAQASALNDALAAAEKLNQRAPNAMASTKELLCDAAGRSFAQQLAAERSALLSNLQHPNAAEGMAAFLAKRPAVYS
jgi:enoyl-CoA hydratase/carnithine racemase